MKTDHNILWHPARNSSHSGLLHTRDTTLAQFIENEQNTILPFPYFFVLHDYEHSELRYISPNIEKLYGISGQTIYKSNEHLLFEMTLEDEKPAVKKFLKNVWNVHFYRGEKYLSDRVFIVEYHVQRSNRDILHIMHQNEVLSFTEDNHPKIAIARFVDMSWLFEDGKDRIVKSYMYNRRKNKIERYTDKKVAEHPVIKLTPREEKVQQLINYGFTSKQIARKLRISVETVKTHRKNINSKQMNA